MIKASDAIRAARSLIGTPYSELDCINLIKKVIRTAPGGVPSYTTAGTNTLWRSFEKNSKYRDITDRYDGLRDAQAGMLAFKASGEDFHHVGIVTGENTVIHSSSTQGGRGVVETPLSSREGWTHLAVHRYIETSSVVDTKESEAVTVLYQATISTNKDPLRVRAWPETGEILGHIDKGCIVDVLKDTGDGWPFIRFNELEGYASKSYLTPVSKTEFKEEEPPVIGEAVSVTLQVVIKDSVGNEFRPVGECTIDVEIVEDSID